MQILIATFLQRIYWILGVLLLLSGMYAAYLWYQRPFDAWNLMPSNPILILESDDLDGLYLDISHEDYWKKLQSIPHVGIIGQRMQYLGLLLAEEGGWEKYFSRKKMMASVHLTSKESFDALFFIPLPQEDDRKFYQEILSKFQSHPSFKLRSRGLRGIQIFMVNHLDSNTEFSWIIHKGFLIGSYAPILIEDVVRKISSGERAFAFARQNTLDQIGQIPEFESGRFRVYINNARLREFLRLAVVEDMENYLEPLNELSDHMYLHLKNSRQGAFFQGFSYVTPQSGSSFLKIFENQQGQAFTLRNYVPLSTGVLFYMSFHQPELFYERLRSYWYAQDAKFERDAQKLANSYDFPMRRLYQSFGNELALCLIPSGNNAESSKLLIVKLDAPELVQEILENLSRKTSANQPKERIQSLEIQEFPAKIWGKMMQGFAKTYYTRLDSCLLLSNDINLLKKSTEDIRLRRVWGQVSPALGRMVEDRNFYIGLNLRNSWDLLYQNARPGWQEMMNQYEPELQSLDHLGISFNYTQDYVQTELMIQPPSVKDAPIEYVDAPREYTVASECILPTAAYTQVFRVENHLDGSEEMLVQDFSNQLYLLNSSGKVLWKKNAGAPIRVVLPQLDIYHNDKLQYPYLTSDRINLVDRMGQDVPKFPFFKPDSVYLHTLAIHQFGESDRYYFLCSNTKGDIYMYNDLRERQPGWRPNRLRYPLVNNLQVLEMQGQYFLLGVQVNGVIQLFHREGHSGVGFPLRLDAKVSNPLWIQPGLKQTDTYINCLTDEGKLLKINMLGEIIQEKQLIRPSSQGRFFLCPDRRMEDMVIAIADGKQIEILNKNGEHLFSTNLEKASSKLEIQYFVLENLYTVIAITDKIGSRTYLYSLKGKALAKPFPSNQKVDLVYEPAQRQLHIYRVHGNRVGKLTLQVD